MLDTHVGMELEDDVGFEKKKKSRFVILFPLLCV
jgi:hypothetical protein